MTGEPRRILEWGWAGTALEEESGDAHVVAEFAGGALVGVVDGLGHGLEAAVAARRAVRVLESCAGEPLAALVERCHEVLRGTRGAVMTLASFDAPASRMTWAGVGNVEALLLRAAGGAGRARESIAPRGGIVGYHLPGLYAATLPVAPGDTLVMATDGIRGGFGDALAARGAPQELAEGILARWARGSDDALVVVARYLGAEGGPGAPGPEGATP